MRNEEKCGKRMEIINETTDSTLITSHSSFHISHSPLKEIAHLNIIGFRAAVAALEDRTLLGRPYVIAASAGGRAIAWDVSAQALRQNIRPGMALAAAERIDKDLKIIPPDPAAYKKANAALEAVVKRYAPIWQNDGCGNLYLDITGTRSLFGPPADCICRIQNEIIDSTGLSSAAAAATNKLVSKVASRAIRPEGLVEVRAGDESGFLAHQDITLLPGLGPSILRTIRVTGFREMGELAALSDAEALSLFGKKGIILRDGARGIDNSPVAASAGRVIESRADFCEDLIEEEIIFAALASAAEHAGLEMRRDRLGAAEIKVTVSYADGLSAERKESFKRPLVFDRDLTGAAIEIFRKAVLRRIRIRSINLALSRFVSLDFQPDLFEVETEAKSRRLQEAVDKIQERYGAGTVTRALVLAAANIQKPLSISAELSARLPAKFPPRESPAIFYG